MAGKPNLSVEETARWLGVTPRTVYRLVKRGRLPGFKVGGQWRFNRRMLESWVANQVTKKVTSKRRVGDASDDSTENLLPQIFSSVR